MNVDGNCCLINFSVLILERKLIDKAVLKNKKKNKKILRQEIEKHFIIHPPIPFLLLLVWSLE